jgi:hypothetical protein
VIETSVLFGLARLSSMANARGTQPAILVERLLPGHRTWNVREFKMI